MTNSAGNEMTKSTPMEKKQHFPKSLEEICFVEAGKRSAPGCGEDPGAAEQD